MKIKIKILEPAKVYDINNLKAKPIAELPTGTEIEVEDILKAWKAWHKISMPDGTIGVFSGSTKIQTLGVIAPKTKAGGWSNFVNVLRNYDPRNPRPDMMDCIKEYEEEIVNHIQTHKNPESVIWGCSRAGADWLLHEEVIKENVVDTLSKKALKPDVFLIQVLTKIEHIQKRQLISDEIIEVLIEKARRTNDGNMQVYTGQLIDIALMRESNELVDDILDIYRTSKYKYIDYGGFRGLHKIAKDDRVVDFLITQLDREFKVVEPSTAMSISDLFVSKFIAGPAQYAAEELLEIGDPRGIAEIIPRISASPVHGSNINDLAEWCVKHSQELLPYLIEGIDHEDKNVRSLGLESIIRIKRHSNEKECLDAIKRLRNDPDRDISKRVKDVLEYWEKRGESC